LRANFAGLTRGSWNDPSKTDIEFQLVVNRKGSEGRNVLAV